MVKGIDTTIACSAMATSYTSVEVAGCAISQLDGITRTIDDENLLLLEKLSYSIKMIYAIGYFADSFVCLVESWLSIFSSEYNDARFR